MYEAVTHQISVSVFPAFLIEESDPDNNRFVWTYTVEITNFSERIVQLVSRFWQIIDGNGRQEQVRGQGVVGQQPILHPGQSFRYTSGCPLSTTSGIMGGSYHFVDQNGLHFDIVIPTFSLDSPFTRKILN